MYVWYHALSALTHFLMDSQKLLSSFFWTEENVPVGYRCIMLFSFQMITDKELYNVSGDDI